jgi:modulator of FtsH protease
MSTYSSGYEPVLGRRAIERDARGLLGRVMGYVAATLGFAALGAYLGRDLDGGLGLIFFIGSFAAIAGLNVATARGREQLATGLLLFARRKASAGASAMALTRSLTRAWPAAGNAAMRCASAWTNSPSSAAGGARLIQP